MKRRFCLVLILCALAGTALGASSGSLPFLSDNFQEALNQARQRHVPIFVECWAPW